MRLEVEQAEHVEVVGGGVLPAEGPGLRGDQRVGVLQQVRTNGAVQGGQLDDRPPHGGQLVGQHLVGERSRRPAGAES